MRASACAHHMQTRLNGERKNHGYACLFKFVDRRFQRFKRCTEKAGLFIRGTRLPAFQLHCAIVGSSGQSQDGRSQRMRSTSSLQYVGRSGVRR